MAAEPPEDPLRTSALPPLWSEALTRSGSPQETVRIPATRPAPTPREPPPPRSTQRIRGDRSDFQLLEELGHGGMGCVYAAVQTALDRVVALKQARAGDGAGSPLFLREASLTGRLEHPNIIPIHDLGRDEEGRLFYAMKLVEGRPWNERAREQSLEVNLGILGRVMDAIAFAHAHGVVHRDLKPSNVMLGDYGEVYVVDWGLAAPIPAPDEPFSDEACFMGGTPAYMPPEVASGTGPGAAPSVDIYLLGAILFELLAGTPPHPGSDATTTFLNACTNTLRPLPPAGELLDIALKALATRPRDRYPSVQAMQADLGLYKAHTESRALALLAAKAAEEGSHAGFQGAVFGYREALRLWPGNPSAKAGLSRVLADYAEAAFGWGDLALAATLLDPADPAHGELRARIAVARRQRDRRQTRLRRLTVGSIALVATLLVTLTAATLLVKRQKDQAVAARRAETRQRRQAQRAQYDLGLSQALTLSSQGKPADGLALLDSLPPGPRGWEFGLLKQRLLARSGHLERVFRKHAGPLYALAAAPEGDRVATGDDAGTVRVWDAGSGEELRVFRSAPDWHGGLSLAFSPDQRRLALGDGTVRSLADGRIVTRLAEGANLFALAFSPHGHHLLGTDYDGMLRLWALPGGRLLGRLRADHETVFHIALGRGGRTVMWGSKDGRIHLADVGAGGILRPRILGDLGAPVMSVAWSRQGRYAAGGNDGTLAIWQGPGQPAHRTRSPGGALTALAFSPGGHWLAGGSVDGVVRVWNAATGDLAMELPGHRGTVLNVAFTGTGLLVTASHDDTARVWRLPPEQVPAPPPAGQRAVATACLDEGRVLLGREDGTVICRSLRDGGRAWAAHLPPGCATSLAVDLPAGRIFCAGRDGLLRGLDPRDGRLCFQAPGPGGPVLALAASRTLVAASPRLEGTPGRTVGIFDASTGQLVSHLTGPDDWIGALAFSPGGRRLAAATVAGGLWVWDTRTWKVLQAVPGDPTRYMHPTSLAFSPDGRTLARSTWAKRVELLDTATWKPIRDLGGQTAWGLGTWTGDGRRYVAASLDGNLRVWDPATGTPLLTLPLPPGPLAAMALSPGGRWLVLALDGRVHAWAARS